MKQPATFSDELRKRLLIPLGRGPVPGRGGVSKTILQRWLDDERAEDVWKEVAASAGANLTAEEFIRFVIRAAMAARALPERKKLGKREANAVITAQRRRVTEAFASNGSPSEIADVLDDAARELRFRTSFAMLDGYPDGASSRRGDRQSRRAFSLTMVDFFKERCGKWMDNETAVLLEITLGKPVEPAKKPRKIRIKQLRGDDNSQEVRGYRKASGRLDSQKPV
jgi:hypothetical protein